MTKLHEVASFNRIPIKIAKFFILDVVRISLTNSTFPKLWGKDRAFQRGGASRSPTPLKCSSSEIVLKYE